jgi:hypothetical protein
MGKVEQVMGAVLVITGLLFAGEALGWLKGVLVAVLPPLKALSGWLGFALVVAGLALILRKVRVQRFAGLAGLVLGMTLIGGSINVLGQWLIENVPILAQLEELTTSKALQTEILKQGAGK